MSFDAFAPEEARRSLISQRGERHQLHWIIQGGAITPRLTCLHGDLGPGRWCAAETIAEHPELLAPGYQGSSDEARDGIITSRWRHDPCRWSCPEDDGPEFLWDYEDSNSREASPTQRHALRFVIGGEEPIEPVFECLHPTSIQCHVDFWRDDLSLFPEWYSGPDSAAHTGTIVSWWATGEPSDAELPHWAYEEHAAGAIVTTTASNTKHEGETL